MIRASFGKSVARSTMIGGLALLAVPAVAGCEAGLNAPTLEFHPASGGAHANFNGISINDAFVLAAPSGSAVPAGGSASLFVGMYNNGPAHDKLLAVSAPKAAKTVTIKGGGVVLPASSAANLTGPEPTLVLSHLTRPLSAGQDVAVTFDFARAGATTIEVPVEPRSDYYSTYSPPPTAAPTGTATATPAGSPTATPAGSASPTATPSTTPSKSPAPSKSPSK
ncbi:MAG: copper chaperone PCu(A)C [Nocardiopsaceae bacterium]|nr:copper chaperone PCu(A)C [Nocardiopsaceae bacterium]